MIQRSREMPKAKSNLKSNSKRNHLLAALSAAEFKHIGPHLEEVDMPLGHVVYESGRLLEYVYFPIDCIVSQNGTCGTSTPRSKRLSAGGRYRLSSTL